MTSNGVHCGYDFYSIKEGFNPLMYSPNGLEMATREPAPPTSYVRGGRMLDESDPKKVKFWLNALIDQSEFTERNAGIDLVVGTQPSSTALDIGPSSSSGYEELDKVASYHDIRYFVNGAEGSYNLVIQLIMIQGHVN